VNFSAQTPYFVDLLSKKVFGKEEIKPKEILYRRKSFPDSRKQNRLNILGFFETHDHYLFTEIFFGKT
jgi:hypothetical protein